MHRPLVQRPAQAVRVGVAVPVADGHRNLTPNTPKTRRIAAAHLEDPLATSRHRRERALTADPAFGEAVGGARAERHAQDPGGAVGALHHLACRPPARALTGAPARETALAPA